MDGEEPLAIMVKRLRSAALAMMCIGLAASPAGAAEEPICENYVSVDGIYMEPTVECGKMCESALERWSLEVARRYGIDYALWHKAANKKLTCLDWGGSRYCRAMARPCR